MKLLLEKARAMDYEVVGLFKDHSEITKWISDNYGVSFLEYSEECITENNFEPSIEDFYEEMELRVRTIKEII
jgi:hypothetical protein